MKYDKHITSLPWNNYELLDSGENMKLERFGEVTIARPETQALWKKQRPEIWENADAVFAFRDKKGTWDIKKPLPELWKLSWEAVHFTAQLTGSKHTGIFPEQAPNWEWANERISDIQHKHNGTVTPKVLNLFGYTGIASIVGGSAGAFITHVDASKQSLDWAHNNARLSNIKEDKIRWVLDDVLSFVKREVRRGSIYDGIILDPPAFGRGTKGEVWKIEEDLPKLLYELRKILSSNEGSFFLVNGYSAGYASRAYAQAVASTFGENLGESGELYIKESKSERVIPSGIYVRFVR